MAIVVTSAALATVPPSNKGPFPEHLRSSLKRIQSEYHEGYWAEKFKNKFLQLSKHSLQKTTSAAATETVHVPIIFGKYSNSTSSISTETFQQLLFDGPNPTGTMTQFYLENSYGQLLMTGKCLGWFPTPRTFDYYVHDGGSNNAGLVYGGPDFTIDVLVESDKTIDFSQFVKYVDAEGAHVPQLGIVHTGADAASGADNIWSHRWNVRWRLNQRKLNGSDTIVNPSNVTAAGRYITNDTYNGLPVIFDGDYAIQPELSGSANTGSTPKAIGVFTHEFGHIFGLPDLYDTDNSSEGLGNWCLMAGGSYGGDGNHEATPAHMSAWCKEQLGWVIPTVATSYLPHHPLKNGEHYSDIVRINVRGTEGGQYFLIENRQKIGFDKYLPNSGFLIFHVDPSQSSNTNENRYKVDLEQADGLRQLNLGQNRGDDGDSFPGASKNKTFDGYSNPNSNDYSNLASYVGVRNISQSDTVMYADFDVGTRSYIQIHSASFVEGEPSNLNGRLEAGEQGKIKISLENIYPITAVNAKLHFSSTDQSISIDTSAITFSVAGEHSLDTVFSIPISIPLGTEPRIITLGVKINTPEAIFEKSFEALLGYPKILLMDLDTSTTENIGIVYRSLVQHAGRYFELVGVKDNTLKTTQLPLRETVIIFTGRKKFNIIPDSLAQELLSFVSAGGNIFLSGQNIAEDMTGRNSSFRSQLLHASFTKNIIFSKNLFGIQSDEVGSMIPKLSLVGGDAVPNQISPDDILVDTLTAHPLFRWNSTTGTSFGGAWWSDAVSGGKVVFYSFGLEGANDSASGVTFKSATLAKIINWFDGVTSTPEMAAAPLNFRLFENFPNPFNPSTTIVFNLPKEQRASLIVYDVLGREIVTLFDGKGKVGSNVVQFNASALSSGVYMYRLQTEGFSAVHKMVLAK